MHPNFAIGTEREIDGFKLVEVDVKKATYQGRPWVTLGDWAKRKFENLLVLSRPKERIRVMYVSKPHCDDCKNNGKNEYGYSGYSNLCDRCKKNDDLFVSLLGTEGNRLKRDEKGRMVKK